MRKTPDKKKPKKGVLSVLFKLAAAAVAVYLVVSFVAGQVTAAGKRHELAELTAKVEQQVETNQELTRLMEADNEDAYIERVAREKLGYARPNEKIFVDLTGE